MPLLEKSSKPPLAVAATVFGWIFLAIAGGAAKDSIIAGAVGAGIATFLFWSSKHLESEAAKRTPVDVEQPQ